MPPICHVSVRISSCGTYTLVRTSSRLHRGQHRPERERIAFLPRVKRIDRDPLDADLDATRPRLRHLARAPRVSTMMV
jgi:hypothetical protein